MSRWKTVTGTTVTRPTTTKKENELSEAAKQAALTLAPVISQRTAPTQSEPVDFDSAFEVFAKEAAQAAANPVR